MRNYLLLFVLPCFSCKDARTDENSVSKPNDSAIVIQDTQKRMSDPEISPYLYWYANYMDSCGFVCDTARIHQRYAYRTMKNPMMIDDWIFYTSDFYTSSLEYHLNGFGSDFVLDSNLFLNAARILNFFIVSAHAVNREGWYPDGNLEEWKFADSTSAINAAKELAVNAGLIYTNTGALIATHQNYMFVFTSRSSGFIYELRPYFNLLVERFGMKRRDHFR